MSFYAYDYEVPEESGSSSEEQELIRQAFESMGSQVPFQNAPLETVLIAPTVSEPICEPVSSFPAPCKPKKKSRKPKWTYESGSAVPIEYVSESESVPTYTRQPKRETASWSGVIPLNEYPINKDENPEVVTKKPTETCQYTQEVSVRYLKPPSPVPHGDIVIQHEKVVVPPPAPPVCIRQQPPRPETPPPLVLREAPPKPVKKLETKVITIPAKKVPPPPRKVIIERLPQMPPKPQPVVVERWLGSKATRRRVIHYKPTDTGPYYEKQKNVIIQWESPTCTVTREYKDLGVVKVNPDDYTSKYGASLKKVEELPDFVRSIRPPQGLALAAESKECNKVILEGDVDALSLIDLDREGLSELKHLVPQSFQERSNIVSEYPQETYVVPPPVYQVQQPVVPSYYVSQPAPIYTHETCPVETFYPQEQKMEKKVCEPTFEYVVTKTRSPEPWVGTFPQTTNSLVDEVLDSLVLKEDEKINFYEAKEFIKQFNERLNKGYSDKRAEKFLDGIRLNRETATMKLDDFKNSVLKSFEFYSGF
ncbi:hypothetical protein BpHYR1_031875 [Brachionus plicatilis]|uniref:Uncharacterized protein n=1 Tax=Brachionus plicatilis TaxID=10195 RepID=A0A3M7QVF6_BRAPC|nr:hypothetical protein BpHYR1_031875 [Brachionus plicatilis]